MDKPNDGPFYGRYIRNAQPIGGGLFLVESQRGRKGLGKVWNPMVVMPNPNYLEGSEEWHERQPWQELGLVKVGSGYRGNGMYKVWMWFYPDYDPKSYTNRRRCIEAYFETELLAVQFMIRNATEFIK